MKLGHCERRITNMVFNSFTVSSTGEELLVSSVPVNLPYDPNSKPIQACQSATADVTASVKATRKSRGTHLLPTGERSHHRVFVNRTFHTFYRKKKEVETCANSRRTYFIIDSPYN